MSGAYENLFQRNKDWVEAKLSLDPDFFHESSQGQTPPFLCISCSDSRVSPNLITGTEPGEIFVHRNIANLVQEDDPNSQSVLQYAIQVLRVRHIIVCGHYGCGGVQAAAEGGTAGPLDRWLEPIRRTYRSKRAFIDAARSQEERLNLLAEENVRAQVRTLKKNLYVQERLAAGDDLQIHGWIYDLKTGFLKELEE